MALDILKVVPVGAPQSPIFSTQSKTVVQDFPYPTIYDKANRWQLSKLCAELGIKHRVAERKATLIHILVAAETSGSITQENASNILDHILAVEPQPQIGDEQVHFVELKKAPVAPGAALAEVPPSPESELWKLAELNNSELIERAALHGIKFRGGTPRAEVWAALKEHFSKS